MDFIEPEAYKKIVEAVPIVCVDVILKYQGLFVLVRRTQEPLKGEWWLVGGRQYKDESLKQTARRKVLEEVGLKPKNLDLVGVYEDSYPVSAWGIPTHSVSIVFTAEIDKYTPTLDFQSSDIRLSNKLPGRFLRHFIPWNIGL